MKGNTIKIHLYQSSVEYEKNLQNQETVKENLLITCKSTIIAH